MNDIKDFLQLNGFVYWERLGFFRNDKCTVIVHSDCYEIMSKDGESYYTNSMVIYELIGYLVYYGLIDGVVTHTANQ